LKLISLPIAPISGAGDKRVQYVGAARKFATKVKRVDLVGLIEVTLGCCIASPTADCGSALTPHLLRLTPCDAHLRATGIC
jgi:hypothetical protein